MYELLKGVRVVEGAAFVAGPSCGLYLAQMGAEVIRFDNIGGGPDFKRWPLTENGDSLYWEGLNRAKKSVAINLSSPEGRALAVRLAGSPGENGGLFVTNFPAEGFLSYEALKKAREDVICVRVMGWADGKPALDYTINCAVGVPEMTGHPEDPRPVNAMLPAWDLLTGAYGAFALTSALIARRMDGKGREIRVPLSDMAATSLAHLGLVGDVIGGAPDRPKLGNALYGAFGRDFTTRDGKRIMMVAITGRQWKAIMGSLGITEAVAALEAELGVSFADDEGLRFDHRDRLFPKRPSRTAISPTWSRRSIPPASAGGLTSRSARRWRTHVSIAATRSSPTSTTPAAVATSPPALPEPSRRTRVSRPAPRRSWARTPTRC
jgi:2-methylfumaryl-CoA isomerase